MSVTFGTGLKVKVSDPEAVAREIGKQIEGENGTYQIGESKYRSNKKPYLDITNFAKVLIKDGYIYSLSAPELNTLNDEILKNLVENDVFNDKVNKKWTEAHDRIVISKVINAMRKYRVKLKYLDLTSKTVTEAALLIRELLKTKDINEIRKMIWENTKKVAVKV